MPKLSQPVRRLLAFLLLGGGMLALYALYRADSRPPLPALPQSDSVFTSTRSVTHLRLTPEGTLWVGTRGGILRRERNGSWRKFTRRDGLPGHEVAAFRQEQEGFAAIFPQGVAVWDGQRWRVMEVPAKRLPEPEQTGTALWRGAECVATVDGLEIRRGSARKQVSLPAATKGTHISALLPREKELWAALFGEGLWAYDGQTWRPLDIGLPREAREITALAGDGDTLWIGTRRDGVWERRGAAWRRHLLSGEPLDHNAQAILRHDGSLFVSALDEGLVVRSQQGWGHRRAPVLSSNAPRQMAAFQGALYLRHGSGKLDRLDGQAWTQNLAANLPRREATAIAADDHRLYAAQWGGWSEFDGQAWTHYLDLPELQGVATTALFPDGDTLWIGTQERGLAEYSHSARTLRWHDERRGLPDDWITTLEKAGDALYAGTFVGGLARWDGRRWTREPVLQGQNVTALAPDASGGLFVATRMGVWFRPARGSALRRLNDTVPYLDTEAQALCPAPGGLWIGTRTGLYFCSDETLDLVRR